MEVMVEGGGCLVGEDLVCGDSLFFRLASLSVSHSSLHPYLSDRPTCPD